MNYKHKKPHRGGCGLCKPWKAMGNSLKAADIQKLRNFDLDKELKENFIQIDKYTYQSKRNPDLMLSVG